MYSLSLFPLHAVLFPGMPLRLHIFEPRYQLMVQQLLETRQPFGVVLIRDGLEAFGELATPYSVGTTANIVQVEPLGEQRMNLTAIGEERFVIRQTFHHLPYLTAEVEVLPLDPPFTLEMYKNRHKLRRYIQTYLEHLNEDERAGLEMGPLDYPQDPLSLGYLAASLLQIPPQEKQPILAASSGVDMIRQITRLYRREIALLHQLPQSDETAVRQSTWLN